MDAFLVVVTVLLIWLYLRKSGTIAVDVREEATLWFKSKGIKPSSARHFIYEDSVLVKNPGAVVVVGLAETEGNDAVGLADVGFVVEVIPGQGVVEGVVLQPSGTATYHKLESQYARMHGMTLIDRLQQKNKTAQEQNKKAGHTEAQYIGDQEVQASQKFDMKKWLQDSEKVTKNLQDLGQPLTNVEKRVLEKYGKNDFQLFHGGDGLSENSPVSINCASMEVAKLNIDVFIKDNCGGDCKRTGFEHTITNPNDSEKLIKVIPVTKPDGTTMEFFFDLSRQVNNFANIVKMFGDKD